MGDGCHESSREESVYPKKDHHALLLSTENLWHRTTVDAESRNSNTLGES